MSRGPEESRTAEPAFVYEDDFAKVLDLLKAGVPVRHKSVLLRETECEERIRQQPELRRQARLRKLKERALRKLQARRIYVFAAGPYVKIGIANDVEARWRTIRGHNPLLEQPVYVGVPLGSAAFEFEQACHRALAKYRRRGTEWFRCSRYLAIETVLQITGESS